MTYLLDVKNLNVAFMHQKQTFHAVRGVDFVLRKGEILGIVGESGCGKSTAIKALLNLLSGDNSTISGEIWYKDRNLLGYTDSQMQKIRGKEISFIIQETSSALNPILKIGIQMTEGYRKHNKVLQKEANNAAAEMLQQFEMPDPFEIMNSYPCTLSVGMLQRVLLAIALMCKPNILIADEPTTGLDARLQSKIVASLLKVRDKEGLSIVLVTHDLQMASKLCDRIMVMYAGKIVETAKAVDLLNYPQHPYTKALLRAVPPYFKPIRGEPPMLTRPLNHCSFCLRCPEAMNICSISSPPLLKLSEERYCACYKVNENEKNNSFD